MVGFPALPSPLAIVIDGDPAVSERAAVVLVAVRASRPLLPGSGSPPPPPPPHPAPLSTRLPLESICTQWLLVNVPFVVAKVVVLPEREPTETAPLPLPISGAL